MQKLKVGDYVRHDHISTGVLQIEMIFDSRFSATTKCKEDYYYLNSVKLWTLESANDDELVIYSVYKKGYSIVTAKYARDNNLHNIESLKPYIGQELEIKY